MRACRSRIPNKWEIHHTDGDHGNTEPHNLICVPAYIHTLLDNDIKDIKRTKEFSKTETYVLDTIKELIASR